MSEASKICVIGAGAWGSALAGAMVRAGHNVVIWGRNRACVDAINDHQRNPQYLGNVALPAALSASDDLKQSVHNAAIVLLVVPAQTIGSMANSLAGLVSDDQIVITCAKGIDRESGKTPVELVGSLVDAGNIGVLSGPSFADDVARGLPTAVTMAFNEISQAKKLSETLSSDKFRIYASDDIVGVELGGALKNVLALAVGVARGMGLGASAEAALIARGFGELRRMAIKMGARGDTLSGLSGLGDLVLTASSTQSRNFSYGIALGQNKNLDGLPLAEGVFSAQIAGRIARENNVDAPIIGVIGDVLAGKLVAQEAVQQLLARPLKVERD